jgi:16S rRNA (cytosine1402-N4)-methyltransferase
MSNEKEESLHEPVLLHEVIEALGVRSPSFIYLDGTLGGAGHARAMTEAFRGNKKNKLTLIGLDRDPRAIERAQHTLEGRADTLILENENFRNLDKVLDKHGIEGVDRILLDLGISSDELENSGKGFSFQREEPLIMTFGDPATYPFTAYEIVNEWDETVLADIIFGYSEDRFARRIARGIVNYRDKKKIESSTELAEIVKGSVPVFARRGKIHPATKTFQALRIAVNDELNAIREGVAKGFEKLNPHGRMAVISFHSLEDRIIKDFYKTTEKQGAHILTKKPVVPTDQEMAENPRSRSAKMRVIEKG